MEIRQTFKNPIKQGCGLAFSNFSNFLQNSSGSTLASTSSWINVRTFFSTFLGSRFDNSIKFVRNLRHFSLALSLRCGGCCVTTTLVPLDCCTCWTMLVLCWPVDCTCVEEASAGIWETDTMVGFVWLDSICWPAVDVVIEGFMMMVFWEECGDC